MEGTGDTESLRKLASQWSLAGDDHLLNILEKTHKRIVSKCQEVNSQLGQMVTALDEASISLQNVNNKFMALSNSQFIESRVYDDDVDVAANTPVEEPPAPAPTEPPLSMLKRSLAVLEDMHEVLTILRDSDTDSDSDGDVIDRVVLKPKDVYAERPLPYIIGSQAWKNKWHAGLLVEDSDTESTASKEDPWDSEQYSESEPETNRQPDKLHIPDQMVSETSSEKIEQDTPAPVKPTPADIAAELARRLGGQPPPVVQEPEYPQPNPTTRKVYRPQQPTAGIIFSDEPPPIDRYQSEGDDNTEDEDSDIFAELHKKKPYSHTNTDQSRLTEDLFGFNKNVIDQNKSQSYSLENNEQNQIFGDTVKDQNVSNPVAKLKSSLFEDESEPELFAEKPQSRTVEDSSESAKGAVKKPVGGMSLFGNNKGAESIGAAILKRNRRKSTSSEESSNDKQKPPIETKQETVKKQAVQNEKDIFDDLFTKSKKVQDKGIEKKPKETVKAKDKNDLFSDNLFDDIDDIFTSNIAKVPIKETSKSQKSIFDDDDDLFADIAVTNKLENDKKYSKVETKDLFDSDDDLFKEKDVPTKKIESQSSKIVTKEPNLLDDLTKTKSGTFTDKPESIFSETNVKINEVSKPPSNNITTEARGIFDWPKSLENDVKKENMFDRSSENNSKASLLVNNSIESKTIFESDSDSDIFSNIKNEMIQKPKETTQNKISSHKFATDILEDDDDLFKTESVEKTNTKLTEELDKDVLSIPKGNSVMKSPPLFDDDDMDDLFSGNKVFSRSPDTPQNDNTFKGITEQKVTVTISSSIKSNDNETKIKNIETDASKHVNKEVSTEVSIIAEMPNTIEVKQSDNIFDNNNLKDDLFEKSKENIKSDTTVKITENIPDESLSLTVNTSDSDITVMVQKDNKNHNPERAVIETPTKEDPEQEEIEGKLSDIGLETESQNELPKIVNEVTETNFPKTEEIVPNKPDIFSEILSEPPAFEKPKEPKKSKNVNALFDDDSDDETLFFKKSDVADEKPDDFVEPKTDMFTIFRDEPPAIDTDLTPKTAEILNKSGSDSDLFHSIPKTSNDIVERLPDLSNTPNIVLPEKLLMPDKIDFPKQDKPNKTVLEQTNIEKPKEYIPEISKMSDIESTEKEVRKIGKLKSINIGIDVNALLPGASPKKVKSQEQTDGQAVSISNEELRTAAIISNVVEPAIVKSVTFEENAESEILDNKLSKERAKIQVKRRPSTRRARREAVRKSGIDFRDNDTTDNSSSIDEPPIWVKKSSDLTQEIENSNVHTKDIKSKVVYILNDEDIFNTPSSNKTDEDLFIHGHGNEQKPEVLNIVDDTDDIFKNVHSVTRNEISDINKDLTDGKNVIKSPPARSSVIQSNTNAEVVNKNELQENALSRNKSFLNNDDSDGEELFNKNMKTTTTKTPLFDSDSEDLFARKSNHEKDKRKEVVVKASLFDDEGDDDLFGAKSTKTAASQQSSKPASSKPMAKSTEPVFEDPLSMLSDDD